jgi:branched-chain amino acid transport system permease protein
MKVIAGSLAAFIAGIGGALFGLAQSPFQTTDFATLAGMVWLAVLVTIGVRSNAAAMLAALAFVFPTNLASYYLSTWTWIPNALPVLFGLGAISAAKYPDGVLAENGRQLRHLLVKVRTGSPAAETSGTAEENGSPSPLVAERAS